MAVSYLLDNPSSDTAAASFRSHVVRTRLGLVYAGVLSPGFGLVLLIGGILVFTDGDRGLALLLLAVGATLVYLAWPLLRRGQLPYVATLTAAGLHLDPRDRTVQLGKPAETIPLSDITGYSEETASQATDGAIQLTLFLTAGRKLRLADRSAKAIPVEEMTVAPVQVAVLGRALQQRLLAAGVAPATLHRPNFYQSRTGRVLAGLCWICIAAGVVLLFVPGVEWTVGLRLFAFSSIYLGMYQRNRKLAAAASAEA